MTWLCEVAVERPEISPSVKNDCVQLVQKQLSCAAMFELSDLPAFSLMRKEVCACVCVCGVGGQMGREKSVMKANEPADVS